VLSWRILRPVIPLEITVSARSFLLALREAATVLEDDFRIDRGTATLKVEGRLELIVVLVVLVELVKLFLKRYLSNRFEGSLLESFLFPEHVKMKMPTTKRDSNLYFILSR
jgi:hypothetical protein